MQKGSLETVRQTHRTAQISARSSCTRAKCWNQKQDHLHPCAAELKSAKVQPTGRARAKAFLACYTSRSYKITSTEVTLANEQAHLPPWGLSVPSPVSVLRFLRQLCQWARKGTKIAWRQGVEEAWREAAQASLVTTDYKLFFFPLLKLHPIWTSPCRGRS